MIKRYSYELPGKGLCKWNYKSYDNDRVIKIYARLNFAFIQQFRERKRFRAQRKLFSLLACH
jgi:hypothetical protein